MGHLQRGGPHALGLVGPPLDALRHLDAECQEAHAAPVRGGVRCGSAQARAGAHPRRVTRRPPRARPRSAGATLSGWRRRVCTWLAAQPRGCAAGGRWRRSYRWLHCRPGAAVAGAAHLGAAGWLVPHAGIAEELTSVWDESVSHAGLFVCGSEPAGTRGLRFLWIWGSEISTSVNIDKFVGLVGGRGYGFRLTSSFHCAPVPHRSLRITCREYTA
mmetsp:Transcript_10240/g.22229  ORF Transcript_10240/g.22229 Transcript_10240/m.22229 type:complete len:216 (+) Transcript_10240:793-1440(+)